MYNNGKVVRDRLGDSIDALNEALTSLEFEMERRQEGRGSSDDRYQEQYIDRITDTYKKCIDLQDHIRKLVYGG
jgi:hypothetical protein